ncbi:MAG: hypothetical protein ACOYXB_16985 [Bacteroidota bacterium]
MGIPRFFKLPKNRQFSYTPIYYDQDKEERLERERRIRAEMGLAVEETGQRSSMIQRGSFRQSISQKQVKANRYSNIRLFVILGVLLLLAYLILYR